MAKIHNKKKKKKKEGYLGELPRVITDLLFTHTLWALFPTTGAM